VRNQSTGLLATVQEMTDLFPGETVGPQQDEVGASGDPSRIVAFDLSVSSGVSIAIATRSWSRRYARLLAELSRAVGGHISEATALDMLQGGQHA